MADAMLEAMIADTEHMLQTLQEDDFLGRIGFTHRLARLKKERDEIHSSTEPESVQSDNPQS
jgi:hypothetical protein